jgi:hypothetical protein
MKDLAKVIKWAIVVTVLGVIAFIIVSMNNPFAFDGRSQKDIEKEWNQPITPSECYHEDCR